MGYAGHAGATVSGRRDVRKRGFLIEGLIITLLGALGVFEGVRLIGKVQIRAEPIGPAWYVIFVSAILLTCGLVYAIKELARFAKEKRIPPREEPAGEHPSLGAGGIIIPAGVFTAYIFLLPILGYIISTLLFFPLALRTFGEKSWIKCVLISVVLTAVFYIGFARVAEVVLP